MFRQSSRPSVIVALAFLPQAEASAQMHLSGGRAPRMHEDPPDRGPGPELGGYTGLPLTEGARMVADTRDASRLTPPKPQKPAAK